MSSRKRQSEDQGGRKITLASLGSFLIDYDVTLEIISSENSYTLNWNNLDKDQLSCILDAFLFTLLAGSENKILTIKSGIQKYILATNFNENTKYSEIIRRVYEIKEEVRRLRIQLGLPSNMDIWYVFDNLKVPVLDIFGIGYHIKIENAEAGFYNSRKLYLPYFLTLLCPMVHEKSKIEVQQKSETHILDRTWKVEFNGQCNLVRVCVLTVELSTSEISYFSCDRNDPLWEIPF